MAVVRSNEELNKYAESKAPLDSPIFRKGRMVFFSEDYDKLD